MEPVVLEKDSEGRITITADEIRKIVHDAYMQGFEDGKRSVPITVPAPEQPVTTPAWPWITPTWDSVRIMGSANDITTTVNPPVTLL